MNNNNDLQKRKEMAIAAGQKNLFPRYIDKAKNAEIWDVEGARYIDFCAGIAVTNVGHCHPKLMAAVQQQLRNFTHSCVMINPYESAVVLAEKLNELVPITHAKTVFLNSGAEAVENAIKIAKAYTKRSSIISFVGAFHGRTHMCLGLTGTYKPYKEGFGPFPTGIYHIPFPNKNYGITVEDSLNKLKSLFKTTVDPSEIAAILIEPVQGEGGFHIAPNTFIQELRALCNLYGILLICDEIQTGFARTGVFFAVEHSQVEPDLITIGKGLANGIPLSAVVGKEEVMDAAKSLGGTFGGSPIGCQSALAVIDIINEENLCERAFEIGKICVDHLNKLKDRYPEKIACVRNLGAMIAIELVHNGSFEQADGASTKKIIEHASNRGLLLLSCGMEGNIIRLLPPLTIEYETLHEGLTILTKTITELFST
ncbi:4-aminobutyrate--2-oxoglutarate transaminase [uncultured Marixanthomonas sp.]|uniref:4-aminobutyrate--2-oxoglutarate transaminase n=1 Tax=uncultured Marixanthomonas sp. TaxID=757245 RepID=UPI0030D98347|tara:strand:- start:16907 stop:18184 length:1278 start_codon:yes stop_codon:yes gene_type:complete